MDRDVLVIGDAILDKTVHTKVRGLSPEDSACFVADAGETTFNLGGAANVAHNVHTLGGIVTLACVVGRLKFKRTARLQDLVQEAGFKWLAGFDTTGAVCRKTRYVANKAMLLRVDNETRARLDDGSWRSPYAGATYMSLDEYFTQGIAKKVYKPVVAFVDYGKGMFEDSIVLSRILQATAGCLRLVDPGRDGQWKRFEGSGTVFKANLAQTLRFCSQQIMSFKHDTWTMAQIAEHAVRCLKHAGVLFHSLVMTAAGDGVVIATADGRTEHLPAHSQQLTDPCGAGDSFMAGMAVRLARTWSGGPTVNFEDLKSAAMYGNAVAGVAVSRPGVVAVRKEQVTDDS